MALVTDPITVTGYDDELYPYLPLAGAGCRCTGPRGAAVAFYPVVIVEYFEEEPPPVSVVAGDVYGGLGPGGTMRHPQVTRVGNRDYGHRVGFLPADGPPPGAVHPPGSSRSMPCPRRPTRPIAEWIAAHDVEVIRARPGRLPRRSARG